MFAQLLVLALVGNNQWMQPPSAGGSDQVFNSGAESCWDGSGAQTVYDWSGDSVCAAPWGIFGSTRAADVAPTATIIKAQSTYPAAASDTQGAHLILAGGSGRQRMAMTAANCGTDTVTPTVNSAALTACTENGTNTAPNNFDCTGETDTVCATNLATCLNGRTGIDACAGTGCSTVFGFSGTAGTVYVEMDTSEGGYSMSFATSDPTCAAITAGTDGKLVLPGKTDNTNPLLTFSGDLNSGLLYSAADDWYLGSGGTFGLRILAASIRLTVDLQLNGTAALSNSTASTALNIADDIQQVGMTGHTAATIVVGAAATTWVATKDNQTVDCDGGGNTVATITRSTGISGGGLYCIRFVDASCTITDTDDGAANTIDLDETDAVAGNIVSADDKTLCLMHDGTSWFQVGKIATN